MPTADFVDVFAVRLAVRRCLAALPLDPNSLVLVACSGGADSLALAAALAYESKRVRRSTRLRGFTIQAGAVIVDHGLQANSAQVAAQAAASCRELGLHPVEVQQVDVNDSHGGGLQAAARDARYAAFTEVVATTGATAVLLAHTADDQAEQVLLSLARGSGTRSLAGILPERGIYHRPLLSLRHAQLTAACRAQGLDWWEDPTNHRTGPGAGLRARVRNELLPQIEEVLGAGAAMSLVRSAQLAHDDAEALDWWALDLLHRATLASPPGVETGDVALETGKLATAPAAVRRRTLRLAALAVGAPPGDLRSVHLTALDDLVVNYTGQNATFLPSGASVHRTCDTLVFVPKE